MCQWRRTLLAIGGLLNATAPMLRYAAVACSGWDPAARYSAVLVSSFVQGAAFGLIGAWPATLAALQWPARRRVVVTAIASLSNYVGGALGTVAMPLIASTPSSLLSCFYVQALAGVPLTVGLLAFLSLPLVEVAGGASALAELRLSCCRRRSALLVGSFGVAVGVSLALQGSVQIILEGSGFTALESGVCNTCYQSLAAVVGVVLGGRISSVRSLPRTLRALHLGAGMSYAVLAVLCYIVGSLGRFGLAPVLAVASSAMLGATLLGMLPFLLQLAVHEIGASETLVSGLVYIVAMGVAASLTQLAASVSALASLATIGVMLLCELRLAALLLASPVRGSTAGGSNDLLSDSLLESGGVRQVPP